MEMDWRNMSMFSKVGKETMKLQGARGQVSKGDNGNGTKLSAGSLLGLWINLPKWLTK